MAAHNDLGKWGEDRAADYLQRKGYRIVARNWKSGHRDIDIIAMDGDEYDGTVVFVEDGADLRPADGALLPDLQHLRHVHGGPRAPAGHQRTGVHLHARRGFRPAAAHHAGPRARRDLLGGLGRLHGQAHPRHVRRHLQV